MSMSTSGDSYCPNPNQGIEIGVTELGCVYDENNVAIGKVLVCKTTEDEIGSEPTLKRIAMYFDGRIEDPYLGAWKQCNDCSFTPVTGFVTN